MRGTLHTFGRPNFLFCHKLASEFGRKSREIYDLLANRLEPRKKLPCQACAKCRPTHFEPVREQVVDFATFSAKFAGEFMAKKEIGPPQCVKGSPAFVTPLKRCECSKATNSLGTRSIFSPPRSALDMRNGSIDSC